MKKETHLDRILGAMLPLMGAIPAVAVIGAIGGVLYLLDFGRLVGAIAAIYEAVPTAGAGYSVSITGSVWCGIGMVIGLLVGVAVGFLAARTGSRSDVPTSVDSGPTT